MSTSIFMDKNKVPGPEELQSALADTYPLWTQLRNFVMERCPAVVEEWNYPSAKYGWSYRIKDKKRAIIYLLPEDKFFKVAFVFGEKAMAAILNSEIAESIVEELKSARKYAEGRGIRISVLHSGQLEDICRLIEIKTKF